MKKKIIDVLLKALGFVAFAISFVVFYMLGKWVVSALW